MIQDQAPDIQMERDAARYRYLRNIKEGDIGERHISGVMVSDWAKNFDPTQHFNVWSIETFRGDALDNEIDQAMGEPND